jgi:hypothetical protein
MSSVKSMPGVLFAIDAMATKQIPLLTTRAREQRRLCEWGARAGEMDRETFGAASLWLLKHVNERVGLIFEHSAR